MTDETLPPIAAVYLVRITVRGDVKPLSLADLNEAVEMAYEDLYDDGSDSGLEVNATSERVDK